MFDKFKQQVIPEEDRVPVDENKMLRVDDAHLI